MCILCKVCKVDDGIFEIFRYEGEEGFSIQAHGFETQAIYTLQNL